MINPTSKHYAALKEVQEREYEDYYFDEDAIYMERNSRDFQDRISRENFNAEMLCDLLRSRRAVGPYPIGITPVRETELIKLEGGKNSVLKEIYYPKFMTPEHYLDCMRPLSSSSSPSSPGFGGLFSLTFTSLLASQAFFDALPCYKGPSLGTNFTLACPYTILAHYTESEWAAGWGVERGLVRISTGLEDPEMLKKWFLGALEVAEKTCMQLE